MNQVAVNYLANFGIAFAWGFGAGLIGNEYPGERKWLALAAVIPFAAIVVVALMIYVPIPSYHSVAGFMWVIGYVIAENFGGHPKRWLRWKTSTAKEKLLAKVRELAPTPRPKPIPTKLFR